MEVWLQRGLGGNWLMGLWTAGALLALVIYPLYDYIAIRQHLMRVGRAFCIENGYNFVAIGHAKAHFSVIYTTTGSGKRKHAKFILHTSFGRLRRVEWLR